MKLLTVDTNVLRDLFRPRPDGGDARSLANARRIEDAQRLLKLRAKGKVDIKATTRVENDIPHGEARSEVMSLGILEIPTTFTVGSTTVESRDAIASKEDAEMGERLMALLFPHSHRGHRKFDQNVADVDHLIGHRLADRDIFITNDGRILEHSESLMNEFNIIVMSTEQFLKNYEAE